MSNPSDAASPGPLDDEFSTDSSSSLSESEDELVDEPLQHVGAHAEEGRPSSPEEDRGPGSEPPASRAYQLEMLEESLKGNIIVAVCQSPSPSSPGVPVDGGALTRELASSADGYRLGKDACVCRSRLLWSTSILLTDPH